MSLVFRVGLCVGLVTGTRTRHKRRGVSLVDVVRGVSRRGLALICGAFLLCICQGSVCSGAAWLAAVSRRVVDRDTHKARRGIVCAVCGGVFKRGCATHILTAENAKVKRFRQIFMVLWFFCVLYKNQAVFLGKLSNIGGFMVYGKIAVKAVLRAFKTCLWYGMYRDIRG